MGTSGFSQFWALLTDPFKKGSQYITEHGEPSKAFGIYAILAIIITVIAGVSNGMIRTVGSYYAVGTIIALIQMAFISLLYSYVFNKISVSFGGTPNFDKILTVVLYIASVYMLLDFGHSLLTLGAHAIDIFLINIVVAIIGVAIWIWEIVLAVKTMSVQANLSILATIGAHLITILIIGIGIFLFSVLLVTGIRY